MALSEELNSSLIIQCPACETRFSVGREVVDGVKNPRFHCSRCDNLFDGVAVLNAISKEDKFSDALLTTKEKSAQGRSDTLGPHLQTTTGEQLNLLSSDDNGEELCHPDQFFSSNEEALPAIKAQWPDGSPNKNYEANLRDAIPEDLRKKRTRKFFKQKTQASEPAQESYPTEKRFPRETPAALLPFPQKPANHYIDDLFIDQPHTFGGEQFQMPELSRKSNFLRPVALICSLPIISLLIFFALSHYLGEAPKQLEKVISVFRQQSLSLAPVGLDLVDLQSDLVTLFDGTQALEIAGKVKNTSLQTLSDIEVEARLFDRLNRPLATKLVRFDNTLSNAASIATMKQDALRDLERKSLPGNHSLHPETAQNVRIVFTDDFTQAKYYMARIYTVKSKV